MKPRFLFPPYPGPKMKITPEMLNAQEESGKWVAQRKFNGSHVVVWLHKDEAVMWNRRGFPMGKYQMPEGMRQCLVHGLERNYETECVLDGELLHNKAKLKSSGKQAAENVFVLFDILFLGKHLDGLTTLERLDLLHKIAPSGCLEEKGRALLVCENQGSQVWLAETFREEFNYRFWEMYDYNEKGEDLYPEIEGLMLKMKNAKNKSMGNGPNDADWMLRCRKTKKNMYQF